MGSKHFLDTQNDEEQSIKTNDSENIPKQIYIYLSAFFAIIILIIFITNIFSFINTSKNQNNISQNNSPILTESELLFLENTAVIAYQNNLILEFSTDTEKYNEAKETLEKISLPKSPYYNYITAHKANSITLSEPLVISNISKNIIDLQNSHKNNQYKISVTSEIPIEEYKKCTVVFSKDTTNDFFITDIFWDK